MDSDDEDLSLVAPHRREEIRRRIHVVKNYLKDPGLHNAENAATELGLSLSSFYNLANAWADHKAELLQGAGRERERKNTLTSEQRVILQNVAKNIKSPILQRAIDQAINLGKQQNVSMPSWNTMRVHLRRMMERSLPEGSFAIGSTIALDHVAVDIPVKEGEIVTMPIAAVVLRIDDGEILGVNLTVDGPSPNSAWLALQIAILKLEASGQLENQTIALECFQGDEWKKLLEKLLPADFAVKAIERDKLGRKGPAAAFMPQRHVGITVKPRITGYPRIRRKPTIPADAQAMTIAEANAFIQERWLHR